MIVINELTEEELAKLIAIFEKRRYVLGYSIKYLKRSSPTLSTHCIRIDRSCAPSREPQRRLNNMMREVVKKKVLKLLHVKIIYVVPFSEWVSPV